MIYINYYPRSGSSLLATYICQEFGLRLNDDVVKDYDMSIRIGQKELAIIRNPFESISSIVSMESNFYKDRTMQDVADKRVQHYLEFYNYILNDFDGLILTYDALINVPHKVLEIIGKEFNLTSKGNRILLHNLVMDNKKENHVTSSESLSNFKEAKSLVKEYDLSECFNLYSRAYSKATI
jgi:hypothetical protein